MYRPVGAARGADSAALGLTTGDHFAYSFVASPDPYHVNLLNGQTLVKASVGFKLIGPGPGNDYYRGLSAAGPNQTRTYYGCPPGSVCLAWPNEPLSRMSALGSLRQAGAN
jgi:hypothetical protein